MPEEKVIDTSIKLSEDVGRSMKELKEKMKLSPDPEKCGEMVMEIIAKQKAEFEASMSQRQADYDVGDFANDVSARGRNGMEFLINKSTKDPKIKEIQRWNDDLYIMSTLLKQKNPDRPFAEIAKSTRLYKGMRNFIKGDAELEKALTSTGTGTGAEWVPQGFSAELVDMIMLELVVARQHRVIPMPTLSMLMGRKLTRGTPVKHVQATTETASNLTTGQLTLTAANFMGYSDASYEFEEDIIFANLQTVKDDLVQALGLAQEDATINGDTAGTLDAGWTVTKDYRLNWKGYRKCVLSAAKKDAGGGALIEQDMIDVRKLLGIYGKDVRQLFYLFGVNVMYHMLNATNFPSFVSVEKYGPQATIQVGELGKAWNIPILISEKVREDLNATGVYDGTTTTLAVGLLVRKDGFIYGDRRGITLEVDKDIKAGRTDLVATRRQAFASRYDESTEKHLGLIYNILT